MTRTGRTGSVKVVVRLCFWYQGRNVPPFFPYLPSFRIPKLDILPQFLSISSSRRVCTSCRDSVEFEPWAIWPQLGLAGFFPNFFYDLIAHSLPVAPTSHSYCIRLVSKKISTGDVFIMILLVRKPQLWLFYVTLLRVKVFQGKMFAFSARHRFYGVGSCERFESRGRK